MMRLGKAPRALPYDEVPCYQAVGDMVGGLLRAASWFGPERPGIAKLLADQAVHALLCTGEAGARLQPGRRELFYRAGWLTTHDCETLLESATGLGVLPRDARLGPDSVVRTAQQQLTIASGAMLQRAHPDP